MICLDWLDLDNTVVYEICFFYEFAQSLVDRIMKSQTMVNEPIINLN